MLNDETKLRIQKVLTNNILTIKFILLGPVQPSRGGPRKDCQARIHFGREHSEVSHRLASF